MIEFLIYVPFLVAVALFVAVVRPRRLGLSRMHELNSAQVACALKPRGRS